MIRTICINFSLKKSKTLSNGTAPVYLRLTVAGERIEFTTRRYVKPERWNPDMQKMTGTTEEARLLNSYLKALEQQVFEAQRLMMDGRETVTAEALKNRLLGVPDATKRSKMLVAVFQEHNKRVAALVGRDYAKGTLGRYEISLRHTIAFMQWQYQKPDMDIKEVDHEFITSYDFYLRSQRGCSNNSTVKYIRNFKKVIRLCLDNGWLDKDPFVSYKVKLKEVKRPYLTVDEIKTIADKNFGNDRLTQVRDIFLFSCYTGLAYIDVKKLRRSEIVTGIDKNKWLSTTRQKTDTTTRVPLLPIALDILKKYENNVECLHYDRALPVLSNQKMNSYLKEIADCCGIDKVLTFHIARHSFATSITLANGVSMESVSKMLGHTNLRTTQHYAKILDAKVSEDMALLKSKFDTLTSDKMSNS